VSSASRASDALVKPTRSTKRTETTRRSATAPAERSSSGVTSSPRAVPHSLQNRAVGAFGVAHDGHV
jgi:hypothetical protein